MWGRNGIGVNEGRVLCSVSAEIQGWKRAEYCGLYGSRGASR